MDAALAAAKRRLRRELDARRRQVSPEAARAAGDAVADALAACAPLRSAPRVALYAALRDELPTRPAWERLAAAGHPPLLPRVDSSGRLAFHRLRAWEELRPGRYGVLEPPAGSPAERLGPDDWVFVPGVAFDLEGHRLGRGGGHYDAAFPAGSPGPKLVGLAYEIQIVESVPHGASDRAVDAIRTELRWHRVAGRIG
jgi:5-formyltetrahydrofolate cyclo-ligase